MVGSSLLVKMLDDDNSTMHTAPEEPILGKYISNILYDNYGSLLTADQNWS